MPSWKILVPYTQWLGNSAFAMWLGEATWRIAGLLTLHLFGFTLLLGTVVFSSVRLMRANADAAAVMRDVATVERLGLVLMLITGALIFTGGAEAYYAGYWFRLKMVLLAAALVFRYTVYRIVNGTHHQRFSTAVRRATSVASLLLWFAVACAGRAIAFF
jgi:hypothetical protein